eukprot:sb/3478605/
MRSQCSDHSSRALLVQNRIYLKEMRIWSGQCSDSSPLYRSAIPSRIKGQCSDHSSRALLVQNRIYLKEMRIWSGQCSDSSPLYRSPRCRPTLTIISSDE